MLIAWYNKVYMGVLYLYSKTNSKNAWVLFLVILAGIVVGGFVGKYIGQLPYMGWLGYGKTFGLVSPMVLDLDIISIQFGFTIDFSIAGILGMIIAIIVYRKL
jgi:hypothetical protein